MSRHNCDAEVRNMQWKTGEPIDGRIWTCSCGKQWQWVEDEAEGGFFTPLEREHK